MKYAVTAATGNFGQTAVKILTELVGKDNVVVIARNLEKANKLFPGYEIRRGDYSDEQSLQEALNGIDRVLFISSQPGGEVSRLKQHQNMVEALKQAQVDFVAYTSFPDAQNAATPLAEDHRATEKLIKESGIKHAFLRNNWYLENEIAFIKSAAAGHAEYWTNGLAGWALEREYAEAAAKVLVQDSSKEIYEFAGPMKTYADLGQAVAATTGKDITVKQVSEVEYAKNLLSQGMDEAAAKWLSFDQGIIDGGTLDHPSSDLADVLGHPTLALDQAIAEILKR